MSYKIIRYGDPDKGSQDGIDEGNLKTVALVTAQTKTLCPVAEKFGGTLRNSYMYKTTFGEGGFNDSPGEKADTKLEGQPEKNSGYVGSNVDYSVYNEFGTRKMGALPHLRPAIDIVVKGAGWEAAIAKALRESMNKSLRKGKKVKNVR